MGELKAILQNWSDDTPVCVSVDNKSKPRDIKRTGTLLTHIHKRPDIITSSVGLFLCKYDDYSDLKKIIIIISEINLDFIKIGIIFVIQN